MSVQHHIISHGPGASCGVSLFLSPRIEGKTVVLTELEDNPGRRLEDNFIGAVRKVQRTYLRGVPPQSVSWVYRKQTPGSKDALFEVQLADNGEVIDWKKVECLNDVVYRNGGYVVSAFIPKFRPISEVHGGRRRPSDTVRYAYSG